MTTAPRDQTPVLLLVNDAPGSPLYRAGGLQFVGKWVSDVSEWCFAAPVGYGGIPDAWLLGWMPLPASRPTKIVEPARKLCSKCGGHQSTHNDTRACKHCGGSGAEPASTPGEPCE